MGPDPLPENDPQPVPASPGSGRFRRIVLFLLILVALVVVLAETGVVTAQQSETNWEARSEYETSRQSINRRHIILGRVGFKPNVTVSVPSGSDRAMATRAADAIRKVPSGGSATPGSKLEITITEVASDGAFGVPFFKKGSCRFQATYTIEASDGGSSLSVRGKVNGNVEQSMTGLCSTGLFREKMGTAVAEAIVKDIRTVIEKYSK